VDAIVRLLAGGRIVEIRSSGRLTRAAYAQLVPTLINLIEQHGSIRLLFVLKDFHGWTFSGLIASVRFYRQHRKQIDRMAIVGERSWQQWATWLRSSSMSRATQYFPAEREDEARHWLEEGVLSNEG